MLVIDGAGRWSHDWSRALVRAAPGDLPLVLYVRDNEAVELLDDPAMRVELVLTNSYHHAASAPPGVTAVVVPSVIEPDLYRTDPTGEVVLFINPVPSKGVETAFAIAEQRHDIPFEFRYSWHVREPVAGELAARAAGLGNVTMLEATGDPVDCYQRARVLLVPYEDMGRPRVVGAGERDPGTRPRRTVASRDSRPRRHPRTARRAARRLVGCARRALG